MQWHRIQCASIAVAAVLTGIAAHTFAGPILTTADNVKLVQHCDRITARIEDLYRQSFDNVAAMKIPKSVVSDAIVGRMKELMNKSDVAPYYGVWVRHFSAVGDQLSAELIEGFIHYQCREDNLSASIEPAADRVDAACWEAANEARDALRNQPVGTAQTQALRAEHRKRVLECISNNLDP